MTLTPEQLELIELITDQGCDYTHDCNICPLDFLCQQLLKCPRPIIIANAVLAGIEMSKNITKE